MTIPFAEGHLCFCGEWCGCTTMFCTHCADDDTYDPDWNDATNEGTEE